MEKVGDMKFIDFEDVLDRDLWNGSTSLTRTRRKTC